jgi:hypothetical protein
MFKILLNPCYYSQVKLAAAKQTQQAMSYLQMQQQQVQALQQQVQV